MERKESKTITPPLPPTMKAVSTATPPDVAEELLEKPTRPLSAYNLYFRDERQRLLRLLPPRKPSSTSHGKNTKNTSHNKIDFGDLAKIIAAGWKKIDENIKARYEAIAEEGRKHYNRKIKAWREQRQALGLPFKRKNKKHAPKPESSVNKSRQQVESLPKTNASSTTSNPDTLMTPTLDAEDLEPLRLFPDETAFTSPNSVSTSIVLRESKLKFSPPVYDVTHMWEQVVHAGNLPVEQLRPETAFEIDKQFPRADQSLVRDSQAANEHMPAGPKYPTAYIERVWVELYRRT
eukprot:scaffold3946_cov177-Amphora_coffeaeformis.AAC.10